MSLVRLLIWTLVYLVLAVAVAFGFVTVYAFTVAPTPKIGYVRIGQALGLPLQDSDSAAHWGYGLTVTCLAVPANDDALEHWLRQQPGVHSVQLRRRTVSPRLQGETHIVDAYFKGPEALPRPQPPWTQLGYTPGKPNPWTWWSSVPPSVAFNPTPAQLTFLCVGCLQGGLLIVGLWLTWRNRKLPAPPPFGEERSLLVGILSGLLLGALYWGCDQAITQFWGPPAALSRSWLIIPGEGWNTSAFLIERVWRNVEPHVLMIALMGGVVLLYPAAQAAFFCGGLLRMWSASGWRKTGVLLTGVLAALLTLEWPFLPAAVVICLLISWLSLRTRSIMVPLVALVVLGAVIVGTAFGAIPSLDHPTNLLVGKWEMTESEGARNAIPFEGLPLQFRRSGATRQWKAPAEIVQSRIVYRPLNYYWTDPRHIRFRWLKDTVDAGTHTTRVEFDDIDYRVDVSYEELTLTRVRDGKVFHYRRQDD